MKNIADVKKEIKNAENTSLADMKPAEISRHKKKLELLRFTLKYLETNPPADFMVNELGRLERIITAKMLEFSAGERLPKKEVAKLKKEHETKYGIPKLRTQLRTLRFILS